LIALDTNILAYAEQNEDEYGRHERAVFLVEKLATGEHCIPLQVLGEFVNVCLRKKFLDMQDAKSKISLYTDMFEAPKTSHLDLMTAASFAGQFHFQFFDAVIVTVARRAGAAILLTEDMQDGFEVAGLKIVNPFVAANEILLADYFAGFP
jgi:predicted nucleic acid-binding protein